MSIRRNIADPIRVESRDMHESMERFVDVQISNDEMLALETTAKELVPAPGSGKAVVVERFYMYFDCTAAYTVNAADNLSIEYGTTGTDIITVETTGFIDQATDQARTGTPSEAGGTTMITPLENEAVNIKNAAVAFGGGNAANTLSVRLYYRIVPMAAFS